MPYYLRFHSPPKKRQAVFRTLLAGKSGSLIKCGGERAYRSSCRYPQQRADGGVRQRNFTPGSKLNFTDSWTDSRGRQEIADG